MIFSPHKASEDFTMAPLYEFSTGHCLHISMGMWFLQCLRQSLSIIKKKKKKKSLPALFETLKLLLMSVAVFPENGLIFSVPVVKPPNRKNHIYDNENNV